MKKKVKEDLNLVRDESTNAILNTNHLEYQNSLNLKRSKQNNSKKIENLENEMSEIKNNIEEIKSMLSSLMNTMKW